MSGKNFVYRWCSDPDCYGTMKQWVETVYKQCDSSYHDKFYHRREDHTNPVKLVKHWIKIRKLERVPHEQVTRELIRNAPKS